MWYFYFGCYHEFEITGSQKCFLNPNNYGKENYRSLNDLVVQLSIYSVVLCMALLNTSNISKSIFNAR